PAEIRQRFGAHGVGTRAVQLDDGREDLALARAEIRVLLVETPGEGRVRHAIEVTERSPRLSNRGGRRAGRSDGGLRRRDPRRGGCAEVGTRHLTALSSRLEPGDDVV